MKNTYAVVDQVCAHLCIQLHKVAKATGSSSIVVDGCRTVKGRVNVLR